MMSQRYTKNLAVVTVVLLVTYGMVGEINYIV